MFRDTFAGGLLDKGVSAERWRRGWDSNPLLILKPCNLLILNNAKNAKTAQNPQFGYAAVTQEFGIILAGTK